MTLPTVTVGNPTKKSEYDLIGTWARDNFLNQNLFKNSSFGVWSKSDANKGFVAIDYDTGDKGGGDIPDTGDSATGANGFTGKIFSMTISSGTFAGGNAAGRITLIAFTGGFIDNEVITFEDGETAAVDGETFGVGVCNDPCNNDGTGDWTDADSILSFDTDHYEIASDAINEKCYLSSLTFIEGRIYKVEAQLKDGTATPTDIELVSLNGATVEEASAPINTTGSFVKYSLTFEATANTDSVGIKTPTSLGGNNVEMKYFVCFEILPCCTAVDANACDGWIKDTTLDIYREPYYSLGTHTKAGSFYALTCAPSAANDYLRWLIDNDNGDLLQKFAGRTIAVGIWAKTSTASQFRITIYDGTTTTNSDYHTGGGDWEWIEISAAIGAVPTEITIRFDFDFAPVAPLARVVYLSQPMLIFGTDIGEGNYSQPLGEVILTEAFVASNRYHNTSFWSDETITNFNIEADSDAMFPKGCRAVRVIGSARDSGSAGTDCSFYTRANASQAYGWFLSPYGLANDAYCRASGWQKCDENGDIDVILDASGANTFDIALFYYIGVKVS